VLKETQLQLVRTMGGPEDYSSFAISLRFWSRSRSRSQADSQSLRELLDNRLVRALAYPFFALSGGSRFRSRITIAAQKSLMTVPEAG
jgi:hypothetical protein